MRNSLETAPLLWWVGIGLLLPLACEASSMELAKQIMAESGFAVHQGDFMAVPAPPELAEWLKCSPYHGGGGQPTFSGHKWTWGGWQGNTEQLQGMFIPVWGASGLRVVEKTYIQAARHG